MKYVVTGLLMLTSLVGLVREKKTSTEGIQLEVLHYKKPCWGESVRLCNVIERKGSVQENLYDSIEGFEYEWGYNYELIVEKFKIEKPNADGSSIGLKLKEIISKVKIDSTVQFELPLIVNGHHMIETNDLNCSYFGVVPINTGSFSCVELKNSVLGVFIHSKTGALQLVELN